MSVLFFKPIPKVTIWGTDIVKDYFQYNEFPDNVGQAWAFSGQQGDATICLSEPYVGKDLYTLWNEHQELFGNKKGEFPVIISLVGPNDDLSIQVHPDSEYAKKIGYPMGKNEAWYFLEAPTPSDIVYGHIAKDKEDLQSYIKQEKWMELIKHLPVKKDDFVYLPAGLLHALKKDNIVYEIQQATDITYRFFDYHRKDEKGNERELHLQQAIDCLSYNPEEMKNSIHPKIENYENLKKTTYIQNDSFTVTKVDVTGKTKYKDENYQLATVVRGTGRVDNQEVCVGSNFLIPINTEVTFEGNMVIMMTTKEGV
ncbi:MAG: type I phosphomannose isomerase catalytic subunit [Coprobacillaceae bacterium]